MRRPVLIMLLLAATAQAQTPTPPPATPTSPTSPPPTETWVARGNADLAGLDKITARLTPLSAKIGQTLGFGSLQITVRSCIVRGPDQPADQAAYLDITDKNAPGFAFHGWMLLSDPAISVLEHPVYDVKLLGCKP